MIHDPNQKPDPTVCPRHFCFMWRMGKLIQQDSIEPPTIAGGCADPFGVCTRLDPVNGNYDGYEAHEPNLREAHLPWFYFYPKPEMLVATMREPYITESEALWGKDHWKQKEGK